MATINVAIFLYDVLRKLSIVNSIFIFARLSLLSGIRSRAIWLILFVEALLLAASFLAGAFSARQPLIVSLDVAYSGVRIGLLFLSLVWTQELLQKDLDKKSVHWALAYPITRSSYLIGKLFGIATLLLLATFIFSLPLIGIAHFATWGYQNNSQPILGATFAYSILALWLESLITLTFTTCMVTISTTPFLAIALGLLFSLAGRGLGAVLDFLLFSPYADTTFQDRYLGISNILRWFLPDLSALDWRQAVLYGHWQGLHPLAAIQMGIGYCLIFTCIAMLIFRKRALT